LPSKPPLVWEGRRAAKLLSAYRMVHAYHVANLFQDISTVDLTFSRPTDVAWSNDEFQHTWQSLLDLYKGLELDSKPNHELNTPGLLSRKLPTVFPYGNGDPTELTRSIPVTLAEAATHLTKYAIYNSTTDKYS
jgi:hypothetical protein